MSDTDLRIEFHESLDELRDDIVRLGALTVETIGKGTAAMLDRDLHAAQALIDGDDVIDTLAISIGCSPCNSRWRVIFASSCVRFASRASSSARPT